MTLLRRQVLSTVAMVAMVCSWRGDGWNLLWT